MSRPKIIDRLLAKFGLGGGAKGTGKEYRDYLWQEPGFHRTLGSIWFQYLPSVVTAFFSIIYLVIILPTFIPAETLGQDAMFQLLLGFFFVLADVGIGDAIQRFISEKRISQPKYTIHYLQFFVWFRMFSGLIVVTGITAWAFIFLRGYVPLVYSMWYFLLYSLLQWPGFWNVFMSALQGYQKFNHVNFINVGMMLISIGTGYTCVSLFKFLGSLNPVIGETMGSTFGFIAGLYVNNVLVFLLSSKAIKGVLAKIDPSWTLTTVFKADFPRAIFDECLRFGVQAMAATFVDTFFKMVITSLAILWLPNYGTIYGVLAITIGVAGLINVGIPITPIVSEAYNNKKIDLTEYYIGHGLKYCGIFASMFGSTILAIAPIFLELSGPYALATVFLPYVAMSRILFAFGKLLDDCTTGCNRPSFRIYYVLVENATRLVLIHVFIVTLGMGWQGFLVAEICGLLAKNVAGWIAFRFKVMRLYMSFTQTVWLPLIAGIANFIVLEALIALLFPALSWLLGAVLAIGIFVIVGMVVTPLYVYWPIYTVGGGWDPVGLDILQEATEIADISKPIAKLFNDMAQKLARKSPLYNKFPIHFRSAQFELDELRVMMGREPRASLHVWDLLPQIIVLDTEAIKRRAFEVYTERLSYDQLVWLLAESTLMVQDVFIKTPFGPITTTEGRLELNPDLLNPRPNRGKIARLAKQIFDAQHPSMEELHWLIAERRWLYHTLEHVSQKGTTDLSMINGAANVRHATPAWRHKIAEDMRAAFKKSMDRMRRNTRGSS
ncbi:MAG: lipopolysaccharide biosynthesis protein [Candidatus Lokiarchaeota archaeon]|nr:lipopolysaccharide biosynthesis protein [Candidatus Lokiarchaeota archaeon]